MISSLRQCAHTSAHEFLLQTKSGFHRASLVLRTDLHTSIGLFTFVGEFTFEVKASIHLSFLNLFVRLIAFVEIIKKFKYVQQGKQTYNFDIVFCFSIYSISAIFLLLNDILA